jgi:hypothetical protein
MEQAEQSFPSADVVSCHGFSLSTAFDCNRGEILRVDGLAQAFCTSDDVVFGS